MPGTITVTCGCCAPSGPTVNCSACGWTGCPGGSITWPSTLHVTISQTGQVCAQPPGPVALTWNGTNYVGSYTWTDTTSTVQTAHITFSPSSCQILWQINLFCGNGGAVVSGSGNPISLTATSTITPNWSSSCNCPGPVTTDTITFTITT